MFGKVCFALCIPAAVCAAQTVVDSISYGNNSTEWQTYATDGAVTAFVPKGGEVWYATDKNVGIITVKTGAKRVLPSLGALSAGGVTCMTQDDAGTIWIGGENGLAAVSGATFKTFTSESGLPGTKVTAVYASRKGIVWVGTDMGAAAYSSGAWTPYTTKESLGGCSVRGIVEDINGTLWFGTSKGVIAFNGVTWTTYGTKNGLSSNDVKVIAYDDRKDIVWAAVGSSDVNSFDGKEWKVYMAIGENITSIMSDTQSRIWFGSSTGIFKYNGFEWVYDADKIGFPATQAGAMVRDSQGNLWFGLENSVLRMKNPYPY
jgi:ligand-binding sensor domain-containing protein